MTQLSETILDKYQKRKSKKQKADFRKYLTSQLSEQGLHIKEDIVGKRIKSHNLIIGDITTSRIILSAHYDTAAEIPFPNLVFPKNIPANIAFAIVLLVVIRLLQSGIARLLSLVIAQPLIVDIISFVVFVGLLSWLFLGKANPHTANDNTSGVISLIEILAQTDPAEAGVCVVLFDNEELGLLGSSGFKKKYDRFVRDQILINFDCVSDGDHLFFVRSQSLGPEYEVMLKQSFPVVNGKHNVFAKSSNTLFPSDQWNFKKYIGVFACRKRLLVGYYLSRVHTRRDVIFDQENIRILVEGFLRFIHLSGVEINESANN